MNRLARQTRKAFQALLAIVLVLVLAVACWWYSRPVLNVFAWESYLPRDVLWGFSLKHLVRVKHHTYTSNAELIAKLKVSWAQYDVVMPSSYMLRRLNQRHLLERLTLEDIPNMRLVQPELMGGRLHPDAVDPIHGVPFLVNYAGIGYNKRLVPNPPKTWREFFSAHTAKVYDDRMLVLNEPRETIGLVLLALGLSPNTQNAADLEKVREVLREVKTAGPPRLVHTEGRVLLGRNQAALLQSWSPEVTAAKVVNPDIECVMPQEGSILTMDTLAIPTSSAQRELAKKFINYLLQPEIAAHVSRHSGYANSLDAKYDRVPASLKKSPSYVEPPPEKRHFLRDVDEAQYLYDAVWAEFTSRDL